MARRGREIAFFSTSAIDLLSCGLAGMLVLWVLLLGNRAGANDRDREAGSARFSIGQYGTSHLKELMVDPGFAPTPLTISVGKFVGGDAHRIDLGRSKSWTLTYERASDGGILEIEKQDSSDFALKIMVSFISLKRPARLRFDLEACPSASELHYLKLDTTDANGMTSDWFGYHCGNDFEKIIRSPRSTQRPWFVNFAKALQTEAKLWRPPVRYVVSLPCPKTNFDVLFAEDGVLRASFPTGNVTTLMGRSIPENIAHWATVPRGVSGL